MRDQPIVRNAEDAERREHPQQPQQRLRPDHAGRGKIVDMTRRIRRQPVGDSVVGGDCDQPRNLETADQQIKRRVVVRSTLRKRVIGG